ncbi:aspartate--tRNA ligase [Patescibacteria group bacterium]|nr:aspartate--tRNA ligase [Patescibacteria group bacterium]MBU1931180.1 aspartate--tRNA ligase [Patescibacteria group bacterium]
MQRTLAVETSKKIGQPVLLQGWVNKRRDHGQIIFIDLRDRSGIVQVVCSKKIAGDWRSEYVIEVSGEVKKRSAQNINPDIVTGQVEVAAQEIKVLAKAETPPFEINADGRDVEELVRLKYRYLDLRRTRMTRNLRLRSDFVNHCRQYLFQNEFVEIETPLLTKSTPEGARDFIVPARLQPGKFYALPQSPQQYKQLLMVAGFERYFQIARCLRDEDLRADRGFEHTQLDMEMSFVQRQDVMAMAEAMFTTVFEAMGATIKQKPFPVFTYKEVLAKFEADKFDLRTKAEKEQSGVLAFAWVVDFPFFEKNKQGNWTFTHNPFSDPMPQHKEKLLNGEISSILTSQYDLVCNGYEVGGGSIRANDAKILSKVFEILGYSKTVMQEQFGHMLEAFKYGVPPHGGIAPGIDRLMMVFLNEVSMKEVVAFPQTSSGQTAVMTAPSSVSQEQLKELGIKILKK